MSAAEVTLSLSNSGDIILRCVQPMDEACKQWEVTSLPFSLSDNAVRVSLDGPGMFAAAKIEKGKKEFIATNNIYYNSDCEYCEESYNCNAESFCVMQNAFPHSKSFMAQVDFDIFGLDESWANAEVCSYLYYSTGEPVINFIKQSPESYFSGIGEGNSSSLLISYKIVAPEEEWVCIDATEMLRKIQAKGYSNLFVSWMGQDMSNKNGQPFNCYAGIAPLDNCGGHKPGGAEDCRPYLKLDYK